eukprot:CAMPEP_0197629440 /NCGR_PEP_ID=MMETSP1338-20131121/7286_1 /TAXON_ID=43686 ORGANISM="Pelagodinium beii, Strain RCC1491" /NCGR_SAMPLE_ID=MMETSP1338 /ASSEMBLY_ACC=CAM_ASM_000754 /LENGTH=957 /DNA_ID=CAMNT_0043200479 /DNA_START=39 /DNA_END=2912 /DNA_ORIENTATION=+
MPGGHSSVQAFPSVSAPMGCFGRALIQIFCMVSCAAQLSFDENETAVPVPEDTTVTTTSEAADASDESTTTTFCCGDYDALAVCRGARRGCAEFSVYCDRYFLENSPAFQWLIEVCPRTCGYCTGPKQTCQFNPDPCPTTTRTTVTSTEPPFVAWTPPPTTTIPQLHESNESFDTPGGFITDFMGVVDEARGALTAELLAGNQTKMTLVTTEAVITVQKLTLDDLMGMASVAIKLEGSDIEVGMPADLLAELGGDVVLQVAEFNELGGLPPGLPPGPGGLGRRMSEDVVNISELPPPVIVYGMMSVDMADMSGNSLKIEGLTTPMRLRLAVNSSSEITCKYWDEELMDWSTEGVTTEQEDGFLVCSTTHLSFFAGILTGMAKALACTRVDHLSEEGYRTLFSGDWEAGAGWYMFLGLVFTLVLMLLVAIVTDYRRSQLLPWSDKHFLFEKPHFDDFEEDQLEEAGETAISWKSFRKSTTNLVTGWRQMWLCVMIVACWDFICDLLIELGATVLEYSLESCSGVMAVLEFVLLIWATWQEKDDDGMAHDKEPGNESGRDRLEDKVQGLLNKAAAAAAGTTTGIFYGDRELITAGSTLALAAYAKNVEDLQSGALKRGNTILAIDEMEERKILLQRMCDRMVGAHTKNQEELRTWRTIPNLIWDLIVAKTPFGRLYQYSISVSSTLRTLIFICRATGSLALCVLFGISLSLNRSRKSPKNEDDVCGVQSLTEMIGALIVTGTASAIFSAIPSIAVSGLHKREFTEVESLDDPECEKILRKWRNMDIWLYAFCSAYSLFCLNYVALYLVSIDSTAQSAWLTTSTVSYIQSVFLIPALIAVGFLALALMAVKLYSRFFKKDSEKFYRSGSQSIAGFAGRAWAEKPGDVPALEDQDKLRALALGGLEGQGEAPAVMMHPDQVNGPQLHDEEWAKMISCELVLVIIGVMLMVLMIPLYFAIVM